MDQNFKCVFSSEVKSALNNGKPVVALESTIFCHGLPHPKGLQTALAMENVVRENGATPAHIAVIDGEIHVGLQSDQIESLATSKMVEKVSRNDLPMVLLKKRHGATTVATTIWIAKSVGIKVFSTGGIGGVHRGFAEQMDISADLHVMAQTSVIVVSAGVKSILDIPKTLEYLETAGVPVVGFGTDDFPAFYNRSSGIKLSLSLDNPKEIAELATIKWNYGLEGAVLVANPIPSESEPEAQFMNDMIDAALKEAELQKISGKKITPFILSFINSNSSDKSLSSNIALALNNAALGAKIAAYL
ncbi:MAG: pseudouridine-5'-phosphate glycosidase [Flavobacteriales bacterium]|nr:pseudouridine-5'-phosphate glycosidase [Flavobacteriales bacterium]